MDAVSIARQALAETEAFSSMGPEARELAAFGKVAVIVDAMKTEKGMCSDRRIYRLEEAMHEIRIQLGTVKSAD